MQGEKEKARGQGLNTFRPERHSGRDLPLPSQGRAAPLSLVFLPARRAAAAWEHSLFSVLPPSQAAGKLAWAEN